MICKSCGAKFSEELLVCPYCGTENEKEAIEQQEEYIEQMHQKVEAVRDLPKQVAKKANSWLTKVVIGLVIFAGIALLLSIVVTKVLDATSLQRQQKKLDKLEALYQAEDYAGLEEYLSNIKEHGGEFKKYEIITRLYRYSDITVGLLESYHRVIKSTPGSSIENDYDERIQDVLKELSYIDELEQSGFVYGEEKVALETRETYIQAIKEHLLLTEEEIEKAQAKYTKGEEDYSEFKKLTLERVAQ